MTDENITALMDALVKLMVAIVPLILALATKHAVSFLKDQTAQLEKQGRAEDLALLENIARLAILAAEELHETNTEKNHYVQLRLYKEAKKAGIPISRSQIDLLLEGSLRGMKNELPLFLANAELVED